MLKLKFAIIGCGRIAERHAAQIKTCGQLVAVCDIVETRARSFAMQYGAHYFFSTESLLQSGINMDVVVICSPNALHAAHAIAALEKGIHVLVEKPMAIHSADALQMMDAAAHSGKQLFTVMQNRFNPPVAAVKQALLKGMFGKISGIQLTCFWNRNAAYYKNSWKGSLALDGGTLFTQFSHFIDLLYWFFGDVKRVNAITQNAEHTGIIEFEDCGVAILEFVNGIIGTINFSVNSYDKNREGSLSIMGEKGMIKIGGEYLNTIEYQQFEGESLVVNAPANPPNEYGTYQGSMSNHDQVYASMINTLQSGQPFYATPFEGFKTLEIIERIYMSAKEKV